VSATFRNTISENANRIASAIQFSRCQSDAWRRACLNTSPGRWPPSARAVTLRKKAQSGAAGRIATSAIGIRTSFSGCTPACTTKTPHARRHVHGGSPAPSSWRRSRPANTAFHPLIHRKSTAMPNASKNESASALRLRLISVQKNRHPTRNGTLPAR